MKKLLIVTFVLLVIAVFIADHYDSQIMFNILLPANVIALLAMCWHISKEKR